MKKGIIDFIYSKSECANIRELYKDESSRPLLQQQIGKRILDRQHTLIDGSAIDTLAMICMNQNFTTDERECLSVSLFVCRGIKNVSPIPNVTDCSGIDLASKLLVSLSFFKPAMVKRWRHHGSPSPDWYRKVSQTTFAHHDYEGLAKHHWHWENFLSERLI